ncbi:PIF1-like helicase, partial [Medicago truncatula]
SSMRKLFVTLLVTNQFVQPEVVWSKTWQNLSDDIVYRQRHILRVPDLQLDEDQIKSYTLAEIERLLQSHGKKFKERYPSMPRIDVAINSVGLNRLIYDELRYNKDSLKEEHDRLMSTMTTEQKRKTFIWRAMSSALRSKGQIVLTVASSGIAALLIPGGRTTHSRFHIPFIVDECSTCKIEPLSPLGQLILRARLIIWDEAPMMHIHCFEVVDRSFRDVCKEINNGRMNIPFGGKVFVLGGDFRQILPVIPKGVTPRILIQDIT